MGPIHRRNRAVQLCVIRDPVLRDAIHQHRQTHRGDFVGCGLFIRKQFYGRTVVAWHLFETIRTIARNLGRCPGDVYRVFANARWCGVSNASCNSIYAGKHLDFGAGMWLSDDEDG